MEQHPGQYLGTEIDNLWWKRYRAEGFFARGNGTYWFDPSTLCFLRTLTSSPLCIPYTDIEKVELGTWHAGRWNLGRPMIKIYWVKEGQRLCSGFTVANDKQGTMSFIRSLDQRLHP